MKTIQINKELGKLSVPEMFTSANTIYVLSSEIDLAGNTIQIPEGCVLKFEEGTKITNGTLTLNNTMLEGAKHGIAVKVNGVQEELDTEFFDLTGDNKTAIMQSIVDTASKVQLHGRYENVFDNIEIGDKEISLIGNGAKIVNTRTIGASAITITSNAFIRIVDLDFNISSGYAIYKNVAPTGTTMLSFMIDRCNFVSSGNSSTAIIQLLGSREGNITNCFFKGSGKNGCIGLNRTDAVNTNVIGCMFSDLSYGIKAVGVTTSADTPEELYSSYACGLNVQSAVMLGCKYGIYIEGNDSFFLNNSMIDYCDNPLVIISQDGANISNNYFSTSTEYNDYTAVVTIQNNASKTAANENKRIILYGNTIYGHRSTNCFGIDMDVESIDCTIQGNTLRRFVGHGIYLRHSNTGTGWATEKLVIDNNRFHFSYSNADGIGGQNYTGGNSAIITNNYAIEGNNTKLVGAGSSYLGNYLSFGNHDYLASAPSGDVNNQAFYASRMNSSRMKINLTMSASDTNYVLTNPMPGESNLVVYVANNPIPINVTSVSSSQIVFSKAITSSSVSFTAIIERVYNL